jgi:hypothetical protein
MHLHSFVTNYVYFQLVVSGVLASYGLLLVSLVEETEVSLREALWTPLTYVVSCCFAGKTKFSSLLAILRAWFFGLFFNSEDGADILLRIAD